MILHITHTQNAELLHTIHAACFERGWSLESFRNLLDSPGVVARVIDNVGFLLTRSIADEMEVLTIAVVPESRRKGVASQLMQEALTQHEGHCFLEVDQHNMAAIRCYENLGFSVISMRENYYSNRQGRSDALVMKRESATWIS